MYPIISPPAANLFFDWFSESFTQPQQVHFQTYINGLLAGDAFSITSTAQQSAYQPCPVALSCFLSQSP